MRNYLLAQDLWDVVESSNGPSSSDQEATANWKRKNAAVLYTLQISCAPEIFARTMGKTSAKEAWDELAKIHEMKNKWRLDGPQSSRQGTDLRIFFEGTIPGKTKPIERTRSNKFLEAIFYQKWDTVIKLLEECDVEGVKKLVQIMSEEEILYEDKNGCTALAYAAYLGKTEIAKLLLTTKNNKLLTIPDTEGMIPVVRACAQRLKETTLYLYFQTLEFLYPERGEHGSLLLHFCMLNEMLVIALDLLQHYPRLAFTRFKYNNRVSTPILTLSAQTSLFPSGTRLSFLQQWIYYGISVASEDKEVIKAATCTLS
ncbi:hypothetical protein SLEP1_g44168 [Rubroshorea leprosula]|uniref:Uncharacterized protein n=1 Tax=Rubroshorea leprosula TaxID=152421 RepID=A0AAV5LGK5_9ROSI|nr:hypothetical protein SLEP1_g44168 [Rubroshorea leprosula]